MNREYYAGIDYHKKYSTVCVLDRERKVVLEATVRPNVPEGFAALFGRLDGPVEVVFECGLNWGYLFDLLEELPMVSEVVLANAFQTRIIAAAQIKTDKIDARKLAWLLSADLIPTIHIPGRETRQRREVVRQRMSWVKMRTRQRNRVHRLIERQRDLQMPQVSDLFGKKGKAALRAARLPEPDAMLLRQDLDALDQLDELIRENEALMKTEMQSDENLRLLMSLPGVGLTIGSVLALEIDGIERFATPARLCAYAGLVPSTYSSGGHTHQGRMLRGCNKWLKWAFIEAAWVAVGCSSYFGGIYRSERARGKKANTAITIVARRMCRIVWQLLVEQRAFTEHRSNPSGRPRQGLTESFRVA
jgi:transposase